MDLHLSLSTRQADTDDGSVEFVVTLHNETDEAVTFTTPSATIFSLHAEDDEGNPIHGLSMGATQAVEQWEVEAGETLSRAIHWESREAWENLYERLEHDRNLDEMWEDVPEDYDELTVTVETCATSGPIADLSLTERVEVP